MSALELMESIFALDEETMLKANHNGLGVVNKTPNRGERNMLFHIFSISLTNKRQILFSSSFTQHYIRKKSRI